MNLKAKKNIFINKFLQIFGLLLLVYQPIVANTSGEESFLLNDLEINHDNNFEGDNSLDAISNPFELVEMIRRANSMNDATIPSDAIDEAIKSFDMINSKENLKNNL